MRNQKGFTLIELIIVIVVLGILAVTAAPQFINFSSDARASALKGMEGSVKGAMQLTYSKAAIEGSETEPTATITVKGKTIDLIYGHPAASDSGIFAAVDGSFASQDLGSDWVYEITAGTTTTPATAVIAQSSSVNGTGTNGAYSSGNIVSSKCYLTYTAASATTATPPVISPASVTVTADGC